MQRGFVIHVFCSLLWLFLQRGGVASLLTGIVGGFLLLWLFRDLLGIGDYTRRVPALVRFLAVFARELILANLALAKAVLFRPLGRIRADFLTYDVAGMSAFEIYLLAQCITLTPGTTTVEISSDGRELLLHAFDAADPAAVRRGIDETLKKAILEFTR